MLKNVKIVCSVGFPCLNTTNIRRESEETKLIKVNEA